jgi:predicted ester cyclase
MGLSENKDIVRALLDGVLGRHQVDLLDELVSPDYVELEPYPGHLGGRNGLRMWYLGILHGFPDLTWRLELQVAEDDLVISVGTTDGNHRRQFFDYPATGRRVVMTWVVVHRVADGRVVEGRHLPDALAFQQQIGEMPPPGGRRPLHT